MSECPYSAHLRKHAIHQAKMDANPLYAIEVIDKELRSIFASPLSDFDYHLDRRLEYMRKAQAQQPRD